MQPGNPFAGFDAGELLEILAKAAQQLADLKPPAIIDGEIAPVVQSRAKRPLAIPQWTTADGQARGVVIQYWSYEQRRLAEAAATDRRPNSPTFGQVDDWRRLAEEVRLGIVEPAGLTLKIVESWGYAVVTYIHEQIERLGPVPPAVMAATLASLADAPPPPPARPGGSRANTPEPDPDNLGDDPLPA